MQSTKEQMRIIHDLCRREINLLKINMDKLIYDSERCQKLLSELITTDGPTNLFGLIVFDRYMTQMVTALNMARKYNIHLEINNLYHTVINASSNVFLDDTNITQTRLLKDLIEWRKPLIVNDREINAFDSRIKMSEHNSETSEAKVLRSDNVMMQLLELSKNDEIKNDSAMDKKLNDVSNKTKNLINILLPTKSLEEFKSGFEFEGFVAYVRDNIKLEFFICLNNDYKTLYDLGNSINFKPIPHEHLPLDDVFCVLENQNSTSRVRLCRAVIVPEERHQSQKFIYLVDFGEVIPLENTCKTYIAPLHYRQIPPLAIKCVLEGIEDSFFQCIKDKDQCKRALQNNESKIKKFRILQQKERVLHVVMLECLNRNGNPIPINNNKETNPFFNFESVENDQNSSTNSDALQLPMSIIYDTSPAKEPVSNISYEVGDKIQVIVTHVVSPISFYGIVQNDYCSEYKTFSWHDRQLFPLQKQMAERPKLNDFVLSQYAKDGYWYRAKVINIDSKTDLYKVFYVDFGNTEVVPLSALAKCSKDQLKDRLRAVLFHLSNLSIVSDEQNVHSPSFQFKTVIENVVVRILDQLLNLEIIERRNEDLIVRLIDSQYSDIPKMLVDMGAAKEIKI